MRGRAKPPAGWSGDELPGGGRWGSPPGGNSGLGQWVLPAGPAFNVGQGVPAVGEVGQVAPRRGVDVAPGTGVGGVLVSGEDHGEAEYLGAGFAGPVDERGERLAGEQAPQPYAPYGFGGVPSFVRLVTSRRCARAASASSSFMSASLSLVLSLS